MSIRFVHVFDADLEPRRIAEIQRIFRGYFGAAYGDYADRIPDMLRRQSELGHRTIVITAEDPRRRQVLAFALALHYVDINATLLDFIVVDPAVRQRGIGGALYEALREYLERLRTTSLYLEVRPDVPELESDATRRRENRARIRFYERYGARVIGGTTYEQKRAGRTEGEPYLMFDSLGDPRQPSGAEVRAMMDAILYRKYAYRRDDPYPRSIIESVPDGPVLLQPTRGSTAPARVSAHHEIVRPLKVLVTPHHRLHHVKERGYVERPVRVDRIASALGVLPGIEFVDVREHGDAPIVAVHDPDFVGYLERVCPKLDEEEAVYPYVFPLRLRDRKPEDEEIQAGYYCMDTFTPLTRNALIAAKAAANCALTGAALIQAGEHLAYALCRPPGHHAERTIYGGFCYFNSAAIAAQWLSARGRVAVLDIDFHHGNGTQDIFYDRGDVLTVSIHGDPSYAYPYFAGFVDERGSGAGEGCNHNFPLPENIGNDEYLAVLAEALSVVKAFGPSVLVLSVGLDIAKGDPTGAWGITPEGFERIGAAVGALGLPTLAVQEGGYDTRTLGRNARAFIAGLQRDIGIGIGD
jgi:acetoin utilization deacetylase AcuC-like enzyme/GNAT superfamily N-acetyltransferase